MIKVVIVSWLGLRSRGLVFNLSLFALCAVVVCGCVVCCGAVFRFVFLCVCLLVCLFFPFY
jgi:hypothetical protein